MNSEDLVVAIRGALERLIDHADELGDLDQALGDGDLGMTVSEGANAVILALEEIEPTATPADVLRLSGMAFASANPSTMAALVGAALIAGARVWGAKRTVGWSDGATLASTAAEAIAQRGKSGLGDKTILDALIPAAEALHAAAGRPAAIDGAIAAAAAGVEGTRDMQSRRGRAAWLQERSVGLTDGGATAILRFFESWRAANAVL